jgi:hypothetical protein
MSGVEPLTPLGRGWQGSYVCLLEEPFAAMFIAARLARILAKALPVVIGRCAAE